jgi:hypothetical protein
MKTRFCPGMTNFVLWAGNIGNPEPAHTGRFVVTFQSDLGSPALFAKIFLFSHTPNHI